MNDHTATKLALILERYRIWAGNTDEWNEDQHSELLNAIERVSRDEDETCKFRVLPEDKHGHPLRRPWEERGQGELA